MIVIAPTINKPTSHSQGDSAVTMRPPSKNPIGARLNKFRKKPVYARARNIGLPLARKTNSHTPAPTVPSIGPPMPTKASIHALRGASFKAMIAPINGMNTGAPTLSPNRRATSKWPHSWTKISSTNPTANQTPHTMAYTHIVRSIVPPVLSRTGRNFRAGRRMNLSLAKNLTQRATATPRGATSFLRRCQPLGSGRGPNVRSGISGGAAFRSCSIVESSASSHTWVKSKSEFTFWRLFGRESSTGPGCWARDHCAGCIATRAVAPSWFARPPTCGFPHGYRRN